MASVFQVRLRNDLAMITLTFNSVLWTAAIVVIALSDTEGCFPTRWR